MKDPLENISAKCESVFTDDDFKRNKEIAERWLKQETLGLISFKPREMLALLARLEAAEQLANYPSSGPQYEEIRQEWLRAAGKDSV